MTHPCRNPKCLEPTLSRIRICPSCQLAGSCGAVLAGVVTFLAVLLKHWVS